MVVGTKSTSKDELFIPTDFYNVMSADYEEFSSHDTGLHNFIKRALTIFPPASKVLDVRCGTGTPVASTIAAHGHKVTDIDTASSMMEMSCKAVPGG